MATDASPAAPPAPKEVDIHSIGAGYVVGGYPAPGLRKAVRHITGHNTEGKSVFLGTDLGDHHRIMGDSQAIANIMYSTKETPVELNGDHDITYAAENEVCLCYFFASDALESDERIL